MFLDPNQNNKRIEFPSLSSSPSLLFSIIVPSYEEQERLPKMLDETIEYLEQRSKQDKQFTWEIIIVDDGSKDKTSQIGLQYAKKYTTEKIRVLTLMKNRGKGGAVKRVCDIEENLNLVK